MSQIHKFKVEMTCTGCSGAVEKVLKKLGTDIENINIDLENQLVMVTTKLPYEQLLETIKKTGKNTSYIETN